VQVEALVQAIISHRSVPYRCAYGDA